MSTHVTIYLLVSFLNGSLVPTSMWSVNRSSCMEEARKLSLMVDNMAPKSGYDISCVERDLVVGDHK